MANHCTEPTTVALSQHIDIPPMAARAFVLQQGCCVRVTDSAGGQPGDLVAFNLHDLKERFNQARTRVENGTFRPSTGATLWSNRLPPNALLTVTADTTCGLDLLYPACCQFALKKRFHVDRDGCQEHLAAALAPWNLALSEIPDPLNLFFQVQAAPDGRLSIGPAKSEPGAFVELRAEKACLLAVATCSVPRPDGRANSGYAVDIQ